MSNLQITVKAWTPVIDPKNSDTGMNEEEARVINVDSANHGKVIERLCRLDDTSILDLMCSAHGGSVTVLFGRNSCTLEEAVAEVRKVVGEVNVRPIRRNLATTAPRPHI